MIKNTEKYCNKGKIIILFFLLLLIYTSNFNLIRAKDGDSLTFRYLPYSIIREFNFDLDEFYEELLASFPWLIYEGPQGEKVPYYLIKVKGHYFPTDGIGPAILALPIFFIPIVIFKLPPESWMILFLSKLVAGILIAFSSVFMYLSAKLLSNDKKAWIVTFIYALCSGMWSITSQVLYQQTGSEFFLAMSVYFLARGLKESKFIPYSGFALASAILMRPTNIIVMLVITLYIFHKYRNIFGRYILYALPVILFILAYNYYNHGSIFLFSLMLYNSFGALYKTGSPNMWSTPFLIGFLGMLISPSRGLFIYSPVFIFSFIGMVIAWKENKNLLFRYFSIVVIGLIIIHSKWYDWWGGWTFGCRMLNDAVPFLSLLLLPFMDYIDKKKTLVIPFIVAIIFSFSVQIIGAFLYDNEWDARPDIDLHQYRLWSWKDSQIVYYGNRLLKGKR